VNLFVSDRKGACISFQNLLDQSPVVTYLAIAHEDGLEVSWVSANAEYLLGVAADELLGDKGLWNERLAVETGFLSAIDVDELKRRGRLEQVCRIQKGDASVWLQETLQPYSGDGTAQYIGSLVDVTTLQAALESRTETDLALMSHMAHELRTPLTGIKLFTGMLQGENAPDPQVREKFLATINTQVDTLNNIIASMRDFQRLWLGRMDWHDEEIDVVKVLAKTVRPFEVACEAKGIEFRFEPETDSLNASIDAGRLALVVYNLLANALRFTAHGGIRLGFGVKRRDAGEMLCMVVEDSGEGMSAAQLETLFDFSAGVQGNVTGLFIVSHIVEHYQGRLRAESTPGKGASFYVELPLRRS
jgi:signal transduction histidine kinase